jgi:predicted lipoprotein with Yx(FWY)xxD motif
MNKIHRRLIISVAVILLLISSSLAFTVDIRANDKIGKYLVNEKGMTLYYCTNDRPKISTCYESCAATWPPFQAEWIDIPNEISYQDFDEIGRVEGIYQTTYKSMPLYLYTGDHDPGSINGEGIDGIWFAMRL